MKDYFSFAHTSIGFSHIVSGKVCQDYSLKYQDDSASVIVVSDGHGSVDFPRSDRGARFACEVALGAVKEFLQDVDLYDLESRYLRDNVVRQLCKHILLRWNMRVEEDVNSDPFTIAEVEAVSAKYRECYLRGLKTEHAYGCTLIAVVITPNFCLALRNGDGQCVVVDWEGKFTTPIPWNNNCEINITTSLCTPEAIDDFRYYYSQKLPAAIFVGSDGVDDSYASVDELYNLYRNICLKGLCDGESSVDEHVKKLLPEITKRGSTDDVSIAGILNTRMLECVQTVMKTALEIHRIQLEEKQKEQQKYVIIRKVNVAKKKRTKFMERRNAVKEAYQQMSRELKTDVQHASGHAQKPEDCLIAIASLEDEYRLLTEKIHEESSELDGLISELQAMGAGIEAKNLADSNVTLVIESDDLSQVIDHMTDFEGATDKSMRVQSKTDMSAATMIGTELEEKMPQSGAGG